MNKKKHAAIKLPITPEEFKPILGLIKLHGKNAGAEALDCLRERYAADLANLDKLSTGISKHSDEGTTR